MLASAPGSGPLLEFEHVSKAFGHQPALADVSFHLARGEIVGFVGPNGAGKSTTLRILAGLLRPDSGTVRVEGVDPRSAAREMRRQIGALIEGPAFYPTLTAMDHLRYVARLRGRADVQPLEATLRTVGLDPRSGKPVGQYSLGMKQRLGIAMAILDAPTLLVLDEPMNGLDPLGMAELREFLRRLPETGTSVLVSSHLLNEVEQACERVLFIRGGRLLADRRIADVRSSSVQVLRLRTNDDRRAEAVLLAAGLVETAEQQGPGVVCRVQAANVGRIAPALVAAQIALFELTPRERSLEEVYLADYNDRREEGRR